MYYTSAISSC